MKLTIAVLVLILAQAAGTTIWDGAYTEDQAKRGADLYDQKCSSCHAPDLTGLDQAPPLAGGDFNTDWNDLSLNDLFERIRISMPADAPGSLERQQVADVLAFLLSKGNFPAGTTELPTQEPALKQIKFLSMKP
jgi:mono/diheme cytochrome c family protein